MLQISQNNSEIPISQNTTHKEEGPFATIGGSIFKVIAMFVGKKNLSKYIIICNTTYDIHIVMNLENMKASNSECT